MSKTQTHTPGPWKAGNVDNIGHGFLIWSEGNGCDVATVKLERDRHLIAAAPAMLAALENIRDYVSGNMTDADKARLGFAKHHLTGNVAMLAIAAITKATGQ